MNLIILEPDEVPPSGQVTLSDARAVHLLTVLKVTTGVQVRVGVLNGPTGTGTVSVPTDRSVTLHCVFESDSPATPQVDLLLALPRPKVLRRLWAQLAALGVGRILLTNAGRVERHYFDTHILTPECYRPLLIEGLQQAKDTRLPTVSIHRRFKVLLEDELKELFPSGQRLLADAATAAPVGDVLRDSSHERVLLAVGPEGGWSRFELEMLGAHGFQTVSLGPRTLRTDTACVALLAVVQHCLRQRPPQ